MQAKQCITLAPMPGASIGYPVDHSFALMREAACIGHAHINILLDGTVFIEWVEIAAACRGQGHFRPILMSLMDRFKTDKLSFETSDDHKSLYEHLGAVTVDYDEFREMTAMELCRKALEDGKEQEHHV